MAPIDLEDNACDIVGKACRGLGWNAADLATAAGLPQAVAEQALAGDAPRRVDDAAWAALAAALGLDGPALVGIVQGRHQPRVALPPGVVRIPTAYGGTLEVNAWLLGPYGPGAALVVDTGTDARAVAAALAARGWSPAALLLTHDHADHVAALPDLRRRFPDCAVFSSAADPVAGATLFRAPCRLEIAGWRIDCLPTPGHTDGSTSFLVATPAGAVCFTGDAVFAGSIGGPRYSLAAARQALAEHIVGLPAGTLLLPGHGPATSIALEIRHNPFLVPLAATCRPPP